MSAMTQARQPTEIEGIYAQAPMKGGATILQGAIVATEAGLAIAGKTGLALTVLGIATKTVKNTGADAAASVEFKRGVFKFFNLPGDAVTAGDVNKDAYLVDDQTVAKTAATNTRSVAGKIILVESDGVFVRVGS
jgi:hypothetical protein